eukprot:6489562-Amphidinium_carterae.1
MRTTTTTRWGMAADAIALARSFRLNVNIYGKSGAWLVRDRTIEGGRTMHLRLANQHYTVMEERYTSIDCEDGVSFYLFREAAGKSCLQKIRKDTRRGQTRAERLQHEKILRDT